MTDKTCDINSAYYPGIIGAVSHELKTKISCIIGALEVYELIKENPASEKSTALIQTALQEAHRLDGVITDILETANIECGSAELKNDICALSFLFDDCLVFLGPRMNSCTFKIKHPKEPISVTTDYASIMRVICILLSNAAESDDSPEIDIRYKKTGNEIVIRIEHNGTKIFQSKIDEILYKHAGITDETNINIPYLCRKIMTALGGTITADYDRAGTGRVYTLTFTNPER